MNVEEVKSVVYDVIADFFKGATIVWAEQVNTKPTPPYLTMKFGSLTRSRFPVETDTTRFYPCTIMLEVNLYTKGKPMTIGKKVTGNYANTATSDLQDMFNYLDSEAIVDRLSINGIDICLESPIRDLTSLENDSKFRYRAMAEATVSFSQEAEGFYGIGNLDAPNSSGGGTKDQSETITEVIKEVDQEEVPYKGGNE